MTLITQEQRAQLLANGALSNTDENHDPWPVVKLFTPDGSATWLLASLDPDCPDVGFGLCDLGVGCPEMGLVYVSEILDARDAHRAGRIVTD